MAAPGVQGDPNDVDDWEIPGPVDRRSPSAAAAAEAKAASHRAPARPVWRSLISSDFSFAPDRPPTGDELLVNDEALEVRCVCGGGRQRRRRRWRWWWRRWW